MNSPLRLSLCILCHDRPDELGRALASASGFDEVVVCDNASEPPLPRPPGVEWIRLDENAGVCAGRNRLVEAATGDVVVFLDDDATFVAPDAADRIREAFAAGEHPVAVAFRVIRPSGETVSSESPFRGSHIVNDRRPCAYFVGCGVAVERPAYERAGGFDDRYRYSTEEIDLSFALQRDGSTLMFEPEIVVLHTPSTRGRSTGGQVAGFHLRNRLLLVRRHLPWPVAVVHAGAWAARTAAEALLAHDLADWLRAWGPGLRWPVERRPIAYRRLREISTRGGRVWW